jgi:ABC-type microcin C transport system permease subunit YejE
MIAKKIKNPLARKRLMRFKEVRRAYFALWALALLYAEHPEFQLVTIAEANAAALSATDKIIFTGYA